MEVLTAAASGGIATLCSTIIPLTGFAWIPSWCPAHNAAADLESRLSRHAHLYPPGSPGYIQGTKRWSALDEPDIALVVEVATAEDVVETIQYANEQSIPFVAYSGGHGTMTTLGDVENGIEIWMHKLDSISIADDGQTATFGGGVSSKQAMDSLWAQGKQTVTGACECTGLLGPALGGGHGFLQGWYGLMVDQFVSMDLVLANGTLITLDEDSDLWWAVKGAGHNFGIVTSVTMKVYDVPHDGLWSYQSFIFTHEKVEQLYETINEVLLQDGNQPVDLINYSVFLNLPDLDPDHSVILFAIFREGVPAVEDKYTKPFIEIGPIVTSGDKGTYHDIPTWSGFAIDSPVCMKTGLASMRFPVDLQRYNPLVQRATYDIFSSVTHQNPALNNSMFLWEGYSLQGVQSIPAESTAYPNRAGNLLVSPVITYEPSGLEREIEARAFGESLRQIVHHGSGQKELYAYVNYAFGDEGPRSWYGYEPWRLDRLRELKAKYDPEHRFNFYAPFT
ncbi:hypothetical protein P175DRAFT_0217630 [Aspergillus ochraceoroseus IBT 24754]|nr:uncharacterized protein P175DRAFT_0217630 [Aspergillus ochraceoroseus IBT 24754]PTU20486.1 hypothetical protein P175DRAFT_0217630 [Aspergillus ochraceoroseus IBT 24754]